MSLTQLHCPTDWRECTSACQNEAPAISARTKRKAGDAACASGVPGWWCGRGNFSCRVECMIQSPVKRLSNRPFGKTKLAEGNT